MNVSAKVPGTRRLILAACFALAAIFLASCMGGGSSVKRTYFSFGVVNPEQARRYTAPRHDVRLRVKRFDCALAYDRQELVYRSNPFELSYDWYRLWVAKPSKMLAEQMVSFLQETNIVAGVSAQLGEQLPHYDLQCDISAIEELDASQESRFAHLAMRCVLTRFSDNLVLWEGGFDEKRPVFERNPVFVVRALTDVYESWMNTVATAIDTKLAESSDSPLAAPAAAPPRSRERPARSTAPSAGQASPARPDTTPDPAGVAPPPADAGVELSVPPAPKAVLKTPKRK